MKKTSRVAHARLAVFGFLVVALLAPEATAQPASLAPGAESPPRWQIDRSHSQVGFSVRHFFTPVEGSFGEYDLEFYFDPESPEETRVVVTIDASSIDSDNARRDEDLRGPSFFEVDAFPTLEFRSTGVRQVNETDFVLSGNLTIRDETHPVELSVKLLGIQELGEGMERMGKMVAGFEAETTIDRRGFGVGTGRWAETVVLGPDVTIRVLLEARLR